jgi:hypothetical protein
VARTWIKRSGSQRGASEISVEDHAGGVDERQQRVTKRLAKLAFDGCRQAVEREVQRFFVQLAVADFLAKAREHDANAFGNGGMTLAFDQRLHVGLPEQFVGRRQFLKERGFVGGRHRGRLCHKSSCQLPVAGSQLPVLSSQQEPTMPQRHNIARPQQGNAGFSGNWQLVTGNCLQRVQIRQQVFDLLVGHDLAEAFHLGPSIFDDVGQALVVCGQPAQRQVLMLEDALSGWGPFCRATSTVHGSGRNSCRRAVCLRPVAG